ncbi:MAG: hypothetical protein RL026_873 [Pseudomonadota bacterium]
MAELNPATAVRVRSPWQRLPLWIGGAALLLAMAVDVLAVIGRHVGRPLVGSIEIVQASVLVSGAAALWIGTLGQVHARVHLLMDRLPAFWRDGLQRLSDALAVIFYLAWTVAALWIGLELWGGHEESELLRIPYVPLRVLAALLSAGLLLLALRALLTRRSA